MSVMKQGSFSRDFKSVADSDEDRDTCIPLFRLEPEEYTDADGVKQWRDREMVTIIMPGNSLTKPDHYVSDEHRKRWPKAYAAFKSNQEVPVTGTPLESWPRLTKAMVLKLKSLGFRTVEDVARMHQQAITEIGAGAMGMKLSAQAYLDDRQKMAITDKAIADAEKFSARCSELEGQNSRLNEALNLMNERLRYMEQNQQFALQNTASTPNVMPPPALAPQKASSPFASFAGAETRQMERREELAQFNDTGPSEPPMPAQESIELAVPAKRRGRPPKAQAGIG